MRNRQVRFLAILVFHLVIFEHQLPETLHKVVLPDFPLQGETCIGKFEILPLSFLLNCYYIYINISP